jgi:hypothetical protein
MAQDRSVTPEKQLLNLIEGSKAKSGPAIEAQAIKHRGLSFLSLSAWGARVSFFSAKFSSWFNNFSFSRIDFKTANRILGLGIFILGLYFVSNLTLSLANINKLPDFKVPAAEGREGGGYLESVSALKNADSYYLEKVNNRDIFKIALKKSAPKEPAIAQGPSSRIMEATGSLKLVGISWSKDPDAIIEDEKSKRTFFVRRGQMIGDVRVEGIFKDKVVLGYAGEEIELR